MPNEELGRIDPNDIEEKRRVLGDYGKTLTDEEVAHVHHQCREFADMMYDWLLDTRNRPSKNSEEGEANT